MSDAPSESLLTAGQQLRQAREARKISLEQASTVTRIRLRYLMALETDDWEVFPSSSQARGFIKAYASYLGLEPTQLTLSPEGQTAPEAVTASQVEAHREEPASGQAESIFTQIGIRLKGQRETLGLSLPDVERHTHLRLHYLQSLERGDLEGLPSPVQGKGMLKNYAAFLGLDPEPLLLRYAEGLQARLAVRRNLTRPDRRPVVRKTIRQRLLTPDMLLAGVMVALLLGFVGWGVLRIADLRARQTPAATAPSIAEVLGAATVTPTLAISATPDGSTTPSPVSQPGEGILPSPTITPTISNAPVQIYLVAKQRGWVQVKVDGRLAFEGRVIPGNAYPYAGNERIELLTGNGAALQVFYKQVDMGTLGSFGEIVERIFTVNGMLTPTPTITPTPLPATPTLPPAPGSPTATP